MMQRRRSGGYGWRNRATENDVFGAWRRLYCYTQKAGTCARVKRRARRRERREAKVEIRQALVER